MIESLPVFSYPAPPIPLGIGRVEAYINVPLLSLEDGPPDMPCLEI